MAPNLWIFKGKGLKENLMCGDDIESSAFLIISKVQPNNRFLPLVDDLQLR